jgi:hypothetical protein
LLSEGGLRISVRGKFIKLRRKFVGNACSLPPLLLLQLLLQVVFGEQERVTESALTCLLAPAAVLVAVIVGGVWKQWQLLLCLR